MLSTAAIVKRLGQAGYRLTAPRRVLVDLIAQREVRFTTAELEAQAAREAPTVGRATIFRTLGLLLNLGLVERVHTEEERSDAYVVASERHHHHLVCSRCGLVREIMGCIVAELVSSVTRPVGFRAEGHWLEIVGLCQRCQKTGSPGESGEGP